MASKMRNAMTYPFPIFNGATVEAWEWISKLISQSIYNGYDYLSMLGLKLNHISK